MYACRRSRLPRSHNILAANLNGQTTAHNISFTYFVSTSLALGHSAYTKRPLSLSRCLRTGMWGGGFQPVLFVCSTVAKVALECDTRSPIFVTSSLWLSLALELLGRRQSICSTPDMTTILWTPISPLATDKQSIYVLVCGSARLKGRTGYMLSGAQHMDLVLNAKCENASMLHTWRRNSICPAVTSGWFVTLCLIEINWSKTNHANPCYCEPIIGC